MRLLKRCSIMASIALAMAMSGQASAQQYVIKFQMEGLKGVKTYDFNSHTFTNCGKTGQQGPTLASCRAAYGVEWAQDDVHFSMSTQGIQVWSVPDDGKYRIVARGAQGGKGCDDGPNTDCRAGGRGAIISGDFTLSAEDKVAILVGQMGEHTRAQAGNDGGGGGGGGTFVVPLATPTVPLLVAGGGSGGNEHGASVNASANDGSTTNGGSGTGAGGGLLGNGDGGSIGGKSFANGGVGGSVSVTGCNGGNNYYGDGGFGGGGGGNGVSCTGGGGGGYQGGNERAGGYSYLRQNAQNPSRSVSNAGHGRVTITKLN